jgi:hypothetical protein
MSFLFNTFHFWSEFFSICLLPFHKIIKFALLILDKNEQKTSCRSNGRLFRRIRRILKKRTINL